MKRLTTRDESGYYHLRRGPKGGEINKITVVQHLGRLEDIALQPTLTPPNEWVSVEERLSERNKRVLVHYSGGQVDIDCLDDLHRYRWESLYGLVTHWMPLPESPKKQEAPHV